MNKLNASSLSIVSSRNNAKPELLRSTPMRTLIGSLSYYSPAWDTQLSAVSYRSEISNGQALWDKWLLKERLHPTPAMCLDLQNKYGGSEILARMEDAFPSYSSTTVKIGDVVLKRNTNPGAMRTSTMCSSLSGGVSGLPTVNKGNLPTDWIASIGGARKAATDSSIPKSKIELCFGKQCRMCR